MAAKVEGYMTSDRVFFESKEEADLHEARLALDEALLESGINPDAYREATMRHLQVVEEYINAYKAHIRAFEYGESGSDSSDHQLTEEGVTAVFYKPTGSSESVSDVGSGERTTSVRGKRKVDGTRSRRSDA